MNIKKYMNTKILLTQTVPAWMYSRFALPVSNIVFCGILDDILFYQDYISKDAIIFFIAYVILMLTAVIAALTVMDKVLLILIDKEVNRKYCGSMKHLYFYAQLIAMAFIIIVPGFFLNFGLRSRLKFLLTSGLPLLAGLSIYALAAAHMSERMIIPLWLNLGVVYHLCTIAILEDIPVSFIMTLITMCTLPVYQYILSKKPRLVRWLMNWLEKADIFLSHWAEEPDDGFPFS